MVNRRSAYRRRFAPAFALALAVLAFAAAPATAAGCPNDEIRAQQGATGLPDCRAYELVSPVEKNGAAIRQGMASRTDGGAIMYWSTGAFAGAQSSVAGNYVGERTEEGWTTTPLNPPTLGRNPVLLDQFYVVALSRDFSRAVIDTRYPVDPDDAFLPAVGLPGVPDLYGYEPGGSFSWLTPAATRPDTTGVEVSLGAATPDLETTVFRTAKQVLPAVPASSDGQLYARSGDAVRLVSVAPGGGPLPGGAVLGRNVSGLATGSGMPIGGKTPSALSDDGQTVWFSNRSGVPQVYVRTDALGPAAATTQVSLSQEAGSLGNGCATEAKFLAASADGATGWFGCASRLTDDATAGGGIYAFDRDSGDLRFLAPSLDGGNPVASLTLVAASEDGGNIWFTTSAQMTADGPSGQSGLYLLHGDSVTFVSRVPSTLPVQGATISADGNSLAYATNAPIDPRAGGLTQVYRHDAGNPDADPVCVSCRPDGTTSQAESDLHNAGETTYLQANRSMPSGNAGNDGSVAFASADRLLPADENDVVDVYQYRADGQLALLSSGREQRPAVFAGASGDGRDVFILTSARLAPQDTDNGSADIYSARVDGGFPPSAPQPGCDEDCQGPPRAPYVPPGNATGVFTGPDDVAEAPTSRAPSFRVGSLRAAQRTKWARKGRVTLTVRASHAGTVRAQVRARIGGRAVVVARAARTLKGGGAAKLTLRLSRRARTHLQRQRSLRLTVSVTHSRVANAQRTTVALRAPAAKQKQKGGRR